MKPAVATIGLLLASAALAGGTPTFDHSDLDDVLRAVVVDERVDYAAIRDSKIPALRAYLDRVASTDADALDAQDRLALFLNLYNATVLHEVARRYETGYSVSRDSFSIFDEPLVRVAGRTISLNDLEHTIVRGRFDEPRIHIALVCAARSCPPLRPRAFTGDDLDTVLERGMRRFVNDSSRNAIDHDGRTLELSRIFDWYGEDFGDSPKEIAAYVDRYVDADVRDYSLAFREYSWDLNVVEAGKR